MEMVKVAVTELEESSTAVYVTTVSPIEKYDPELWLDVNVSEPELSLAVGSLHVTTAFAEALSVLTFIFDGIPVMVGFSLSVKCHQIHKTLHSMYSMFKLKIHLYFILIGT